jgi:DNA repair protein RecN (Recombination protein N)
MLESLSIRNIILIDELDISFGKGLCVLTGETGAGKSILLDALGLALGARAEARLIRKGASKASVTATFSLSPSHPLWQELRDQDVSSEGTEIIFRRSLESDGKSKCFINDHLVSQTLMRRLGEQLVEIHGQFDHLLNPKSHLGALDAYGKIEKSAVQLAFKTYQEAQNALETFKSSLARSLERQTFLRFAIEEIEKVSPRIGEEAELEAERAFIAHRAKIAEAFVTVDQNVSNALTGLSVSQKALARVQDLLPEKMAPLLEASERAIIESQEILEEIKGLKQEVEGTHHSLETLENRLYALKTLCRKYQAEDIVECLATFKKELGQLDQGEDYIGSLEAAVDQTQKMYLEKAQVLSKRRKEVAKALEAAISQELPPLKLEHARFRVDVKDIPEEGWGASGIDRVEFYIQTNPGLPEGPLGEIASGGELSRLMLALKVVLVESGAIPTLIFDEIESGTGGAVASAMGERLKILSQQIQILAITHSPQIASYGSQHFMVLKVVENEETKTFVETLDQDKRYEEVARMLAGEKITEEARAAARRLIGDGTWKQA